jgi:hypothetical protein
MQKENLGLGLRLSPFFSKNLLKEEFFGLRKVLKFPSKLS